MPTVKIGEPPSGGCLHPEHDPPKQVVWPSGVYRHTCPACKSMQTFTIKLWDRVAA